MFEDADPIIGALRAHMIKVLCVKEYAYPIIRNLKAYFWKVL